VIAAGSDACPARDILPNATDPVGVVRPATPVTVNVKVTDCPKFEGLRLDVAVIVTGALVTTCDMAADTAAR
jgi:hypothetical protein